MRAQYMLLVEDNRDDEALILRALQKNGVQQEVVVARDGEEALNYLLGTGEHGKERQLPKFVLLDLKLPKLNGQEVLLRLRQNGRTSILPVIIFTSSNEEKEIAACYSSGANSYVRKSVDSATFNESLGRLCHYWFSVNETVSSSTR